MTDPRPEPQPWGALVPPTRYPPTAVGTDTPEPDPLPRGPVPPRRTGLESIPVLGQLYAVAEWTAAQITDALRRTTGWRL